MRAGVLFLALLRGVPIEYSERYARDTRAAHL